MAPKVVLQATMPIDLGGAFSEEFQLVEPPPADSGLAVFSREELLAECEDAVGVISLLSTSIDRAFMEACPELAVVANYAVGYDNIDVEAATALGIFVCNTPDVLTDAAADLAFCLLLACARNILPAHAHVRDKEWLGWHPNLFLGRGLSGKTLGIVGMGRIGQAMARRARGFDMDVVYHSRSPLDVARREGATPVEFDELVRISDFISLHCPLNSATRGLFDSRAFSLMKRDAILINTARGDCVDETALIRAVSEGQIGGAGLDVFCNEPEVRSELLDLPNVVLAPHIGSATTETRQTMARMCAQSILSVLRGEVPGNSINSPAPRAPMTTEPA